MSEPIVSIVNVEKFYGNNKVVNNLSMNIEEGEFLTMLGPSGCGKTTTLRMIAGFEDATSGIIKVENERVENIFSKSGKLTAEEWKEIKRHPEIGYRILSTVNDMSQMAEYVLAHHERWDGKGYPKGLKGEEIPFVSRIIAIVDSYNAMTSDRSYHSALPEEVAVGELQKNAGVQFDPELVSIFIEKVLGKISW